MTKTTEPQLTVDSIDPVTGEVLGTVATYEPAVLPLTAVPIEPPMMVRALTSKGGLKKGAYYTALSVYMDGRIQLYKAGLHPMQNFVEMLRYDVPAKKPSPANDNGK